MPDQYPFTPEHFIEEEEAWRNQSGSDRKEGRGGTHHQRPGPVNITARKFSQRSASFISYHKREQAYIRKKRNTRREQGQRSPFPFTHLSFLSRSQQLTSGRWWDSLEWVYMITGGGPGPTRGGFTQERSRDSAGEVGKSQRESLRAPRLLLLYTYTAQPVACLRSAAGSRRSTRRVEVATFPVR